MSCIDYVRKAQRVCAIALVFLLWHRPAHALEKAAGAMPETAGATAALAQVPWPESDTVLDLLRADAQAATAGKRLERAQDWLAMPQGYAPSQTLPGAAAIARPTPSGDARDRLDVMAIYGVGRSLYADIAINGALWRYRQGRHWPQGVDDEAGEPRYSLVRIEQPCVRLSWRQTQRTVCLRTEGARHE